MRAVLPVLCVLLATPEAVYAAELTEAAAHPEARPFDEKADAAAQIDAALGRARSRGHDTILIFGANWCHDSRALAGWFATPRFKAMLDTRYQLVWIDVGMKDRHIDLARRFGLDGIEGTPTVLIVDQSGAPLNLRDAPKWRNASRRDADSIFTYFEKQDFRP